MQKMESTRAMYQAAIEQKIRMRAVESTVMIALYRTELANG